MCICWKFWFLEVCISRNRFNLMQLSPLMYDFFHISVNRWHVDKNNKINVYRYKFDCKNWQWSPLDFTINTPDLRINCCATTWWKLINISNDSRATGIWRQKRKCKVHFSAVQILDIFDLFVLKMRNCDYARFNMFSRECLVSFISLNIFIFYLFLECVYLICSSIILKKKKKKKQSE